LTADEDRDPADGRALPAADPASHPSDRRRDVRTAQEYAAGHIPGFRHYPGGQLVQETDMAAPVRGARILLADDVGPRADMTASWLAQMGREVYVLEGGFDGALETGAAQAIPRPDPANRYERPYEDTDNAREAMQAYLDWEYGLVASWSATPLTASS
jgi:rhodanese-related sulfurtransferase